MHKKKKKGNDSEEEPCEEDQRVKRTVKPQKIVQSPCKKGHSANSLRKVESEKITQNMFDEEGNCEAIRLPLNESSDQLSMQVEEEKSREARRLPGVPTK